MTIQWFPGHMHAAQKEAAKTLATIDLILEVVDARIPGASTSPLIHALRSTRQKPCLKVLNKSDLADPASTSLWLNYYNQHSHMHATPFSCKKKPEPAKLIRLCQTMAPHRNSAIKPLRIMIMGIPNVGKSTLINTLLKRHLAKVGNEPAVTRNQQRVELNNQVHLIDTPGLMWPKIEFLEDGLMLASCHAIGRNAILNQEVAAFLAERLAAQYPDLLQTRYHINSNAQNGMELLSRIAIKRGYLIKGGEPDFEKTALTLLTEYRSGTIGRISLETPTSRAQMLTQPAPAEIPNLQDRT